MSATSSFLWGLVHDLVAHPALALTGYSTPARWFHAYTGLRWAGAQPDHVCEMIGRTASVEEVLRVLERSGAKVIGAHGGDGEPILCVAVDVSQVRHDA
jgi:hypothetical protein